MEDRELSSTEGKPRRFEYSAWDCVLYPVLAVTLSPLLWSLGRIVWEFIRRQP